MDSWDQMQALAEIERALAKSKAALEIARMKYSTLPPSSPHAPILRACLDATEALHEAIEAAKRAALSRVGA